MDTFHDFWIGNFNLLVEIGLGEFTIGLGLADNCIDYLPIEREHGAALLALYQSL